MHAMMGIEKPETGCVSVSTDFFSCVFFEGHMFPVCFQSPNGSKMPSLLFKDEAEDPKETIHYLLGEERWAETRILQNNADRLVVECSGTYCRTDSRPFVLALPSVKTTYRYTLNRKSPLINIQITLEGESENPLDIHFLEPAWRKVAGDEYSGSSPGQFHLQKEGWRISLFPPEGICSSFGERIDGSPPMAFLLKGWLSGTAVFHVNMKIEFGVLTKEKNG